MKKNLNRRRFLQSSGGLCLIGTAHASVRTHIAYLGFDDGIHVYSINEAWRRIQTLPSHKPASLLLHPKQPLLFAANDIEEHNNLPHATVEAFRIDESGCLHPINQAALSLSAIRPRHLAIASQTNHLIVTSSTGGLYNLLSFDANGQLAKPTHIRKELGCGPHHEFQSSAHPHSLLFDSADNLLASDLGCDRLSVFQLHRGKLVRSSHRQTRPGDGPGPIALDPSRSFFYVLNVLDASVSRYSYSARSREVGPELARFQIPHSGNPISQGSLAVTGDNLVAALNTSRESVLAAWTVDDPVTSLRAPQKSFYSIKTHPDGKSWLTLDRRAGRIVEHQFHLSGGSRQVAEVHKPLSLVFKSL